MRRLCLEAGCPNDATYRGRCRAHARRRNRETSPNQALYNKAKWKRTRDAYRFEHPMCERCGDLAHDIHHRQAISDGGDPWAWDNLEALCRSCHAAETRREQVTGVGEGP